jgi:uncharacterized protein (DUF1810 family)
MDEFNLRRFVEAQQPVIDQVLRELAAGRKTSHWMWFIFPQMKGIGRSSASEYYGIASLWEAQAYLAHPVLGERLRHCTSLVNSLHNRSASEIFGGIDSLKFRSSMTLFSRAAADNEIFHAALRKYFEGEPDSATIRLLGAD